MSNENIIQSQEDNTLPYGTSGDSMLKLLDAIKKKQGDEKGIRAIYSGGKFDSTRKSLEVLGIIDGLNLLPIGKELAFETNETKKQDVFLKTILNYPPYEYFLTYIHQAGYSEETDIELVKNFWGRNDYGSSPNNRDEGVSVFCHCIELAGLGEYVVGRRGKTSRIKWSPNTRIKIESAMGALPQAVSEEPEGGEDLPVCEHVITRVNESEPTSAGSIAKNGEDNFFNKIRIAPNITINVDMSEWDTEKITTFFKAAYGEFNDYSK